MNNDFLRNFFKNAMIVVKIISQVLIQIGYFILLFLEKIFYPLEKLRKTVNPKQTARDLEDYISQLIDLFTKKRDLKLVDALKEQIGILKAKRKYAKKSRKAAQSISRRSRITSRGSFVPSFSRIKAPKINTKILYGVAMFLLGLAFTVIFVLVPSHIYLWLSDLPNPELLVTKANPTPTRILDREGRLLFEVFVDRRYEPVKLDKVPADVINATIAVEDDEFYHHIGFDISSMIRAAKATFLEDTLQGGSTITQQLIKNVLLSPERTVSRKMKELVLAVAAEAKYTKSEILELYLNNISYGGTAWGIQSAAQKFFGKNVWELNLAEASLLAGLPSSPTTYSPLSSDPSLAKSRQRYVLERMTALGYVTKQEADEAFAEELVFATQTEYIRAPHFVAFVREDLEKRFGRRFIEFGGLTITTTLDLDLQDEVQDIVTEEVDANSQLLISNGAAVVMDAQEAEILAYVGSIDYFKDEWGAFDVASAYRQPGSSIKPVTYALALENGYTAASSIKDKPVSYRIAGQPPYTPKNYDGQYHGDVTLRAALANSYNIPAVRLASSLGPDNIVQKGKEMGLSNWEVDGSYGLSITLGGKEVRLLDHTNLFGTFARAGEYKESTPYLSIKDANGFEVYRDNRSETRVFSKETAYIIWHILSDNGARTPAFGPRSALVVPGKTVAAKTGTTDNIKDNWTMGFTPSYVVGVWVGNNDNTPLHRSLASGLSGAAPIWNRIVVETLADEPDEKMPRPADIFVKTDNECKRSEIFAKGSRVPSKLCPEEDDDDKDKDKDKDDE